MAELLVTFAGGKSRLTKLPRVASEMPENMAKGLRRAGAVIEARAKKEYTASGLRVRSNRLRGGISSELFNRNTSVRIGPNVFYGEVHEFGMTINAKSAAGMTFRTADGNWVRTQSVRIPARPYMGPAADKEMPQAIDELIRQIMRPMN
ncbi:hypothetical protein GF420_11535 [candidate division GN15 bacterium]|nr:hypothetical protein [candidate division GN15 bacterium]